jgi:hypothetical protein
MVFTISFIFSILAAGISYSRGEEPDWQEEESWQEEPSLED